MRFLPYDHPAQVLLRVLQAGGAFYWVDFTLRWATQPQVYAVLPYASVCLHSPTVREAMASQAGFIEVEHHYTVRSSFTQRIEEGMNELRWKESDRSKMRARFSL